MDGDGAHHHGGDRVRRAVPGVERGAAGVGGRGGGGGGGGGGGRPPLRRWCSSPASPRCSPPSSPTATSATTRSEEASSGTAPTSTPCASTWVRCELRNFLFVRTTDRQSSLVATCARRQEPFVLRLLPQPELVWHRCGVHAHFRH
jgi:hypothetical protein